MVLCNAYGARRVIDKRRKGRSRAANGRELRE